MIKKILTTQVIIIAAFVFAAAIIRLLSFQFEWWNFTPIGAMALFSGAYFKDKKMAFIVPLTAMILSDAIIGFYNGIQVVYIAMCLVVLVGFLLQNRINIASVIGGSLAASVIFFLVTNFALIYPETLYPHTVAGIITSYTAGLPFFKNTIMGDLIFSAVLFGAYQLVKRNVGTVVNAT
ncbi:MAG: hypothetical protein LH473_11640 [Chitinophagales bacterium]|nr:hypothetical protein [Chitinophagales bacterium]